MNSQSKSEYIAYKMLRAKESLSDAEYLLKDNRFQPAVNRLYYACFYAVTALLISHDLHAKKHSGVKHMFGLHFIITGKVNKAHGTLYTELFSMRQAGDYDAFVIFETSDIVPLVDPVRALITEIELYLSNLSPSETLRS